METKQDSCISMESKSRIPRWYSNTWTQLILLAIVFFLCPGMFNALNGMGFGGHPEVGKWSNLAVYLTWFFVSWFTPMFVNVIGAKWSLLIGTVGYPVWTLCIKANTIGSGVGGGIILGACAGFLWNAQGQFVMSYPGKDDAAKFFSVFWIIFNLGGVMGDLISFGMNYKYDDVGPDATAHGALSNATYWGFFGIMIAGVVLSLLVLPLTKVTRQGRPIEAPKSDISGFALVKREVMRTVKAFAKPTNLLLAPLFLWSNWFYQYHGAIEGALFNGRTMGLVVAMYWGGQILGSALLQFLLDYKSLNIVKRMWLSAGLIFAYIVGVWCFTGFIQYDYDISYQNHQGLDFTGRNPENLDLNHPGKAIACLVLCGITDAFVQCWSYWVMRLQTDDPEELARSAGFYKCVQNFGNIWSFVIGIKVNNAYVDFWVNVGLIAAVVIPTVVAMTRIQGVLKAKEQEEVKEKELDADFDQ